MAKDDKSGAQSAQSTATAEVISAFGGLRPMGKKLGIAVSTLQGWQSRGHIPESRAAEIQAAAAREDVTLDPRVLAEATGQGGKPNAGDAAVRTTAAGTPESPSGKVEEGDKAARPQAAGAPEAKASRVPEDHSDEEKLSGALSEEADAPAHERAEVAETRTTGGEAAASDSLTGAAAPEPTPAAPPPPPERRGGLAVPMLLGALLVVIGLGIAVVARDLWLPAVDGAGNDEELQQSLAGLQQQMGQLEQRLAEQPAAPQGLTQDEVESLLQERTAALDARFDGLAEELQSLESAARSGPDAGAVESLRGEIESLTGQLSDLSGRIDGLEGRIAEATGGGEAALVLALVRLRDGLSTAAPYGDAVAALEARLGSGGEALSEPLDTLKQHAEGGLPTRRMLAGRFSAVARDIAAAGYAADESWYGAVLRRVNEVVSIRPVGEDVAGDDPAAVAARAEAKVAAGDLQGAVAELETLSGPAAEAASGWLSDAKARLAAEAALAEITSASAERLAPSGQPGGQSGGQSSGQQ